MLCVAACAVNTNDIMHTSHGMCAPGSWPSIDKYYTPENTYMPAIHVS